MKILLIHKSNFEDRDSESIVIPNGLTYIDSLLKSRNYDTTLLNLSNNDWRETKEIIAKENPDIVGISCYTFNRPAVFKLAKLIKQELPNCKIVIGGPHASVMYNQILEHYPFIDFVVIGEGELTFLELVENINNPNKIKGIAYRKNNEIIINEKREPIADLDSLPMPAEYYSYKRIITSRGCPGKCIFCDTPHLWGNKIRFRSAKNVVDEIELLNKKYSRAFFIFSDDTFTADKQRVIGICKEIIDRKLQIVWDCRSRVNFIDEERLEWMKNAGCVSISYGIESGSEKILKNIKKFTTKEQIIDAAKLTRKYGLFMNFFLIVGSPGEDDETIKETIDLIKETKPLAIQPSIMEITPGTKIYQDSLDKRYIKESIWLEDSINPINYFFDNTKEDIERWFLLINDFFKSNKPYFDYSEDELRGFIDQYSDSQSFNNLGAIFLNEGELNQAKLFFYMAIEKNKGNSLASNNMGVVCAMDNQYKDALEHFEKALKMDPEDIETLKNLGITLIKLGQFDKAKETFDNMLALDPNNKAALGYLTKINNR